MPVAFLPVHNPRAATSSKLRSPIGHGALSAGESAVIIATEAHLAALEQEFYESGVNVVNALIQGRYIALLADDTLRRFMVNRWPDERLFADCVTELIAKARRNGRQVRAFGEMVALLWSRGDVAATKFGGSGGAVFVGAGDGDIEGQDLVGIPEKSWPDEEMFFGWGAAPLTSLDRRQ